MSDFLGNKDKRQYVAAAVGYVKASINGFEY